MFSEITKAKMSESAKRRCTDEWKQKTADRLRTKIDDEKLIAAYESGKTIIECAELLEEAERLWQMRLSG